MSKPLNIEIGYDSNGRIITNDDSLNKTIREVENESKAILGMAIPAITIEGEDPDLKNYMLLLSIYEDDKEYNIKEWKVMTGRQNVYDHLKLMIKAEALDPNRSFIIPVKDGTCEFEGAPITVFRFMKVMRDNDRVLDGDEYFDISEYEEYGGNGDATIFDV